MPELREHQLGAVNAAQHALSVSDRTQVVMACGTGKTLVGRAVADRLAGADGLVGVLVPSLALLAQTLRAWREAGWGEFEALAVCSDGVLADDGDPDGQAEPQQDGTQAASETVEDMAGVPVTTDPWQISAWINDPVADRRMRVVF